MSFLFLPSLQHLATVKVTLSIYYDDIIQLSEESLHESLSKKPPSEITFRKKWLTIQEEASKKLSNTLLPDSLKKRVVQLLQPLSSEVQFWLTNHYFIIIHGKKDFANYLCWKSEGTIDRVKTAKYFIQDEKIDIRVRFVLACIYCWEFEISKLWREMNVFKKRSIHPIIEDGTDTHNLDTGMIIRFWMKRMKRKDKSPWSQAFSAYLNKEVDDEDLGITSSAIYVALDRETRWAFFEEKGGVDDPIFCMNHMGESDRHEMLLKIPNDVLLGYLRWPFQNLFMVLVNSLLNKIQKQDAETESLHQEHQKTIVGICLINILTHIEKKFILADIQDFDYRKLHKDLSNIIAKYYPHYDLVDESAIGNTSETSFA